MTDDTRDEGWVGLGLCDGGCHVRVTVPVGEVHCVVTDLTPQRARALASDLLNMATRAERHPENAAERRH